MLGEMFAFGGSLSSIAPVNAQQLLFSSTNSQAFDPNYLGYTQLVVEVASVPEPATLALVVAGVLLLVPLRRRRV